MGISGLRRIIFGIVLSLALSACSSQSNDSTDERLKVIATTTIVGDVVSKVAGDLIDLEVLLPVGTDPHTFVPTPQDLVKISQADILFINGVGLETFLESYLESAGNEVRVIEVSEGGKVIQSSQAHQDDNDVHEESDPHTWNDPENVKVWVDNIAVALIEIDPNNAKLYRENAEAYQRELDQLDTWIAGQVAEIPLEKRKIISDHDSLAYFAERYGFKRIGTVIPSVSTLAEPSAKEIAQLEDVIRQEDVDAIFADLATNPVLVERIAKDTGAKIVLIYSGSLTEPEGQAGNYIDYMRYNVSAIVEALK
jgi:ABC-type Zn uptake system ZnuABC Zn-binding protein ZnuA